MCTAKTPKVEKKEEKPVEYLHNEFLDGKYGLNGLRIGRQQLRTDSGAIRANQGVGIANPGSGLVLPSIYTIGK